MKVLGICGSHRGGKSTGQYLKEALAKCAEAGLETETVDLAGMRIDPCDVCEGCRAGGGCVKDDDARRVMDRMERADAIIVASPTYFASVSGKVKTLMDRTLSLRRKKFALDNKVGGAITVGASRNGGQEFACLQVHNWMFLHGMIVVADSRPTAHFGGIGVCPRGADPAEDKDGMQTSENLGRKVAEVVRLIRKA
jgi:multimeric flavodoxin WrbA